MHIIFADGIGSAKPGYTDSESIIMRIVERLVELNPSWTYTRVIWPASMATVGGKYSWKDASAIGFDHLTKVVADKLLDNPDEMFILLGYSGGNKVIHDWLNSPFNSLMLEKIAAVGLMSDPWRPENRKQAELPHTYGWGICGQDLGPIPDRTFWTTVPGDVISDASHDAILRTAADASDAMPGGFLADLIGHLEDGNLQLAWQIGVFRDNPLKWILNLLPRMDRARIDIEGYFGGKHTTDYTTPYAGGRSLAHRLADSISYHVNRP